MVKIAAQNLTLEKTLSTIKENAEGVALWAREHASTDEIVAKLVNDDRDAFFWHVACMNLPLDVTERIERIASQLIANGYERPASE